MTGQNSEKSQGQVASREKNKRAAKGNDGEIICGQNRDRAG